MVSFYWAFQTITTVGFGDISIGMTSEYVLSLLWMVFGVSFYSFTVGNITSIIASIDTKAGILTSKLSTLQAYSLRIDLPQDTSLRIQRFLENDNKDLISQVDQDSLFKELPPSLRSEVVSFTHGNVINKIGFFKGKNVEFLWKVMPLLKPRKLYRGDLLYSEGDVAEEIYFVLNGSFTLYVDASELLKLQPGTIDPACEAFNIPYTQYGMGSYFGDQDCLIDLNQPTHIKSYRDSTAEANDDCDIQVIKKRALEEQLQRFPEYRNYMVLLAKEKTRYTKILIM